MGIKHCGKSTQGKLLANYYACPFIDTDAEIAVLTGMQPRELYVAQGAAGFMDAEARVCKELEARFSADSNAADGSAGSRQGSISCVVATGGGICNNRAAVDALVSWGIPVFLQADEKLAADRIVREARVLENGELQNLPAYIAKENPRSLQDVRAVFHRFYEERTALYSGLCEVSVQMQAVAPELNRDRILAAVRDYMAL
ncbi:MAG: hypothetical protein K6G80_11605 [Treponema sp.]|nr:hypothetical protein [Treponema sp.]